MRSKRNRPLPSTSSRVGSICASWLVTTRSGEFSRLAWCTSRWHRLYSASLAITIPPHVASSEPAEHSRSCCVFEPGAAHMSRTRWPGRTSSTSGGTIETSSCRLMLPSSTSCVKNSWNAASVDLDAASSGVGSWAGPSASARRTPLPRSIARDTSNRHASLPGSHGIGVGGGTAPAPGTTSCCIRCTCLRSIQSRSARAVGSSGRPVMRNETPSGVRSAAKKASHSDGGTRPRPR
mmetsp:Transcript_8936/g.28395  ORF Transcript_8936/g.28395 Transcript_8936/m.28395 type:complete len:236 (+) Transcript_8936:1689-2396(+)